MKSWSATLCGMERGLHHSIMFKGMVRTVITREWKSDVFAENISSYLKHIDVIFIKLISLQPWMQKTNSEAALKTTLYHVWRDPFNKLSFGPVLRELRTIVARLWLKILYMDQFELISRVPFLWSTHLVLLSFKLYVKLSEQLFMKVGMRQSSAVPKVHPLRGWWSPACVCWPARALHTRKLICSGRSDQDQILCSRSSVTALRVVHNTDV